MAAEAFEHRLEQADLHLLQARLLLHRRSAGASASVDQAVEMYRAMGLPGRVEAASSLLSGPALQA